MANSAGLASSYDAIVIGGGYAGLVAARDLRKAGRSVLVVEARDRLGGRAWGRQFEGFDHQIEMGAGWVVPEHHHFVVREMERYGIGLAERPTADPSFVWRFDGEVSDNFPLSGDQLYELERALFEIKLASGRIDTALPHDEQDLADLDVSVQEYLRSMGLSDRTYDFLVAFAALGAGAAAHEWSALTGLTLVQAYGGSPLAWYAAVVDRLRGGTEAIVRALLQDGDPDVLLSTRVTGVAHGDDEVVVTTANGDSFAAATAVVAIPVNVWGDVEFAPDLSPEKARLARDKHAGRISKVWVLAEGIPRGVNGFGPGNELLMLTPQYEIGDLSLMAGFSSPPTPLDVLDTAAVTAAVHQYFPDANVIATDAHDWNADPFSRGAWQMYRPGVSSRCMSQLRAPEGRVVFAGSDIATRWIGWLDGALETGVRAADLALAQIDTKQRGRA